MKKNWKLLGVAAAVLLLCGCGSSSTKADEFVTMDNGAMESVPSEDYYEGEDGGFYDEYAPEMEEDNSSVEVGELETGRKLIKTVNLSLETKDFDGFLGNLESKISSYGGYTEELYTYNGGMYDSGERNASLTVRIPKKNLDAFLKEIGSAGNIISRTESVEDVTLTYVDMESHKKVLLAEQERLLSFLEEAETIEEIITIESRLSDVRYQIESMESQLRTFDNQIDYSTVYLDVREVEVLTPSQEEEKTAWERIREGFTSNMETLGYNLREFGIGFVICLPYILFGLVIVLIIVGIIVLGVHCGTRKNKKQKKNKK